MTWPWWEQYDEVADELDEAAREKVAADRALRSLLHRAADDIRTLTDGLKSEGQPKSPEAVLAMLPRDSEAAKHVREALELVKAEEGMGTERRFGFP